MRYTFIIQISTSNALSLLNEFHQESKTCGREGTQVKIIVPSDEKKIISLDDIE